MSKVRVAVIGAGGQVGSNLLDLLRKDDRIDFWGICRNEITAAPLRLAGNTVRVGSVAQPEEAKMLFEGCDVVVNCAAASGPPATARQQDEAVLKAVFQLPSSVRVIHLSSVGIYGSMVAPNRGTFEHPRPDWDFGRGKLHLEKLIRKLAGEREVLVLRLGHVYGAGQWVCRFVLQSAAMQDWRLPYDGRLKSNAVHVRNATEALRTAILSGPTTGTFNLVDPGQSTWREVFDWTTGTLNLERVPGLNDQDSDIVCSALQQRARTPLSLQAAKEAMLWARSLPSSFFGAVPTSKTLGSILLARMKSDRFESVVLKKWNSSFAGISDPEIVYPAYLCSVEAPGPAFAYSAARGEPEEQALQSWYRNMHTPDAIVGWSDERSARRTEAMVNRN